MPRISNSYYWLLDHTLLWLLDIGGCGGGYCRKATDPQSGLHYEVYLCDCSRWARGLPLTDQQFADLGYPAVPWPWKHGQKIRIDPHSLP